MSKRSRCGAALPREVSIISREALKANKKMNKEVSPSSRSIPRSRKRRAVLVWLSGCGADFPGS